MLTILFIAQALSYTFSCSFDPGKMCESFQMIVKEGSSAFIEEKFLKANDAAMCSGKLVSGSLRYMVDKTAPSSVVGTLFPQTVMPGSSPVDPTGTLEEDGQTILLYSKDQILGFKATQANWAGAELSWECSL